MPSIRFINESLSKMTQKLSAYVRLSNFGPDYRTLGLSTALYRHCLYPILLWLGTEVYSQAVLDYLDSSGLAEESIDNIVFCQ
jgi:hypothetical protein